MMHQAHSYTVSRIRKKEAYILKSNLIKCVWGWLFEGCEI